MPFLPGRNICLRFAAFLLFIGCGLFGFGSPSWASSKANNVDPYVRRYLDVQEPVSLVMNAEGQTRVFSAADLSAGKRFFEDNCKNCHVGGATLPNPTVPLSLEALRGATPPRDMVLNLVTFLRQPMTYDGSEETYACRQVPESWLSQEDAENVSAFILRSAQKAPGWGNTTF
ncbi:photosystem II cytochrome PsbV2 [Leptolyngbya sp. NK1-12]|uniref:Photosystem II cytochrome PsbV2 n=1 Tax=Leptolyngbya sp. NK1-12 TaxID=2547451 RepID=A0AA96WG00_9CYAN|nr:photosystem II cytochrome PsbV2 [Leptolyngbya sp. NK1-12]WNZ24559.1 photosystem II cytochrome PsbV2 [Leptolyngbya sp. NK1-12]